MVQKRKAHLREVARLAVTEGLFSSFSRLLLLWSTLSGGVSNAKFVTAPFVTVTVRLSPLDVIRGRSFPDLLVLSVLLALP